jgi:hypothetical protein
LRLLDYHVWIGGKALRWADDVWEVEEELERVLTPGGEQ